MNIVVEKEYSITNKKYLIDLNCERTNNLNFLNIIFDAMQMQKIKNIKEYFSFLSIIGCNENHSDFLSTKNKKDYMIYLKEKIKSIQKYNTTYFSEIYPVRHDLLSKIKTLDGCTTPVYEHNSATGRSKITSGTNFMTMKKEKRNQLAYNNQKMFEVDFNSCEPYFYLLANNKIDSSVSDVYEEIENVLNIQNKKRSQLKLAIISVMYGAQYKTVQNISGLSKQEYNKLLDYLGIEDFSSRLINDINEKGHIHNFYNRPVIVPNNRLAVNYWVQSSVADFCYLAFNNFVNNLNLNFHAIIHDAIICSASEKRISKIKSISKLTCPVSKFKIPVSFHEF